MDNVVEIDSCRLCHGKDIPIILDFGRTALAISLVKAEDLDKPEFTAPLRLVQCSECGCVQLKDAVKPEILFKDYVYISNTNPNLVAHFNQYAKDVVAKIQPSLSSRILGIGGNSADLEVAFKNLGFTDVFNVEPSTQAAKISELNDIKTINDFFNLSTAFGIQEQYGGFDIITSNNCVAHVLDLNSFFLGIKWLLNQTGVFIFENAYWKNVVEGLFLGQIYSEHIFGHTLKSLKKFLAQFELEIFDVELNNQQNGSFRCYVQHLDGPQKSTGVLDSLIEAEEKAGLFNIETYNNWKKEIDKLKQELIDLLERIKTTKIAIYSWPAKATTIASYFEIGQYAKYVVEDSEYKVGRFTPQSHLPIKNRQYFIENPPDYALIMATNCVDQIIKNNPQYKGKWIVPMPFQVL